MLCGGINKLLRDQRSMYAVLPLQPNISLFSACEDCTGTRVSEQLYASSAGVYVYLCGLCVCVCVCAVSSKMHVSKRRSRIKNKFLF